MRTLKPLSLLLLFVVLFSQCKNSTNPNTYPTNKLAENDPFAETMVESQTFELDPTQENIIEGEKGVVVLIPEGALVDGKGNVPKGKVTVELAEALDVEDMLLSNLTTTSHGKPLESAGMLYLNATADGKQLKVNRDKPLQIEVPTDKRIDGMQIYRGIRDEKGNMNWIDPVPLENYLTTVDLSELDFLPEGFYDTVKNNMPYRGHEEADKALADSLYYSLAVNNGSHLTSGLKNTNMNEAQYNRNKEIKGGKYTNESFDIKITGPLGLEQADYEMDSSDLPKEEAAPCGINPASIKVIKGEKFANSYIATREFEQRMRRIHRTCEQAVLDIYIEYIDKNLWEADKRAYEYLKAINHHEAENFLQFYEQKLGKVKDADNSTKKLAAYYKKQLQKVEDNLKELKEKEIKKLEKENKKFERVKTKYRKTLWKREKYRNEKYGWEWTNLGWINIDKPGPEPKCGGTVIETKLNDPREYDRVYCYVLLPTIKSMYRLNTSDNKTFYAGNPNDKILHIPCEEAINLIFIGYKGEQAYLAATQRTPANQQILFDFPTDLEPYTQEALKATLKKYNGNYAKENSITKDLDFQLKFYKEQQRQNTLKSEQEFIQKLNTIRYRCCSVSTPMGLGQSLFEKYCTSCHAICSKAIGPSLYKVHSREGRSESWLVSFTQNAPKMIASGDPLAVKLFEENNKQNMPPFEFLTERQIYDIFIYTEQVKCKDIGGGE